MNGSKKNRASCRGAVTEQEKTSNPAPATCDMCGGTGMYGPDAVNCPCGIKPLHQTPALLIAAAKRVDAASKAYFDSDPVDMSVDVVAEFGKALDSLRQASCNPSHQTHLVGEPVAFGLFDGDELFSCHLSEISAEQLARLHPGTVIKPLFLAPSVRIGIEYVHVTDEMVEAWIVAFHESFKCDGTYNHHVRKALEAALALALPPSPKSEMVGSDHRYSVAINALREIADNGDGTGRNPQLMVNIAMRALKAVGVN